MNAFAPTFGCATDGMPFQAALAQILGLAEDKPVLEQVVLTASAGRVLAETFNARLNLPGFDQSAMDGYAVRCAELIPGALLPITGRTAAGEAPGILAQGGAHRILTGAPLPVGADAVVPQEAVYRDGDLIRIATVPPVATNVRRRGEDIHAGDALILDGTILDWRHITVLAAQGVCSVTVRRRPRVALLSSGRELRGPGESLAPGQIHDSNMPMLAALLGSWGADVRPMAVIDDNAVAVQAALQSAAGHADLVLTTAGISVGDEDHVRDAVRGLGGDLTVLKVAMKPGKPLAAGRLGAAVFIGLPGNPIASLAGAVGFVRPLLARMTGTTVPRPLQARAAFEISRKPNRSEFIPVRLDQKGACLWAERAGPDGSGRLAPLLHASGLAHVPGTETHLRIGRPVDVIPFDTPLTD
jgi:molybdopterin molybdotransferase